ncbi:hypothetical protein OAO01_07305 [Oligoflexia bacterium]|nr:hypothetical protein [Oligoflexia bacterium]
MNINKRTCKVVLFRSVFSVFGVFCLFTGALCYAATPKNATKDVITRVVMAETNTLSWQPSSQNPGNPPSKGKWQNNTDRDKALKAMAMAIACVYNAGKSSKVAKPISKKAAKKTAKYQQTRAGSAAAAALAKIAKMSDKEFCLYCLLHHHFYKRFFTTGPNGEALPGSANPPGYSAPNKDGSEHPENDRRPTWDRDPNTQRTTYGYVWDNGSKSWVQIIFPSIADGCLGIKC